MFFMQEQAYTITNNISLPAPAPVSTYMLATVRLKAARQPQQYIFGNGATEPPSTNVQAVMQRGDEVNAVQRMLTNSATSAVFLTGESGAGKSVLAALLYRRFQLTAEVGLPAPKHFVWLSIGEYTTLPDVMAAILSGVGAYHPGFFFQKPDQQIATLLRALQRPLEPALIVLDQFEQLLYPETERGLEGRGEPGLFLAMLLQDLGISRVLLTCYRSPYDTQNGAETRVRSFLVSRISLPEGVALMQQRGLKGSYEELSLLWQRCSGHVFALVLFSTLVKLSKLSLSYLLNAPDYKMLWSGDVCTQLMTMLYLYLNPVQHTLVRVLALFQEPIPEQGLFSVIMGENPRVSLSVFAQELQLLKNLSLVRTFPGSEQVISYALHPLLRRYIIEHYLEGNDLRPGSNAGIALGVITPLSPISGSPEGQDVAVAAGHLRVAEYYRQLNRERALAPDERSGPQDIANLLSAIRHYCLGWHWQQACDLLLAEGIYESMVQWGAWNTLIGLYLEMLPPNGVLTRRDEGLIYNHLGLLFDHLGNLQKSYGYYEQALIVQRKVGDQHGEAITLTNQGELLRSQGQLQHAYANFEQARILNQQLQDLLLESVLLNNLGLLHHAIKDYAQAALFYQEALRFAQNLKEPYNKGMILTNIGIVWYEQGHHAASLAVMLYTLQLRSSLQYATINFIEQFLDTLEQQLGQQAYAQLRQAARYVKKDVLAQLLPAG
jgi:tetratricopeptide (TPR) repeat protein